MRKYLLPIALLAAIGISSYFDSGQEKRSGQTREQPEIYTVQKGDTLSEIAREFHCGLEKLLEENPDIKDSNKINIGDRVKIPSSYTDFLGQNQRTYNSNIENFVDEWVGTPYLYSGKTKKGIDCSALAQKFYAEVFDEYLPRTTREQKKASERISYEELLPGDLVFPTKSHVGIYVGNNKVLIASSRAKKEVILKEYSPKELSNMYFLGRPS